MKRDTVILMLTVIGQGLAWLADLLSKKRRDRDKNSRHN